MIIIILLQHDPYTSWDIMTVNTDINAIKRVLIGYTIPNHYEWLRIEVWENGKLCTDEEFHTSNITAGLKYLAQFEGQL